MELNRIDEPEAMTQKRLPWRMPVVQLIQVALDTRDAGGSSGDGEFGTVFDVAEP